MVNESEFNWVKDKLSEMADKYLIYIGLSSQDFADATPEVCGAEGEPLRGRPIN